MRPSEYVVGDVVAGEIRREVEGGYLVEIAPGVTGKLPHRETAWLAGEREQIQLPPGSALQLRVIEATPRKHSEGQYLTLSVRALLPNPWERVEEIYPVGTRIQARISEILEHGAIVLLPAGLRMLVHNSEISWTRRNATAAETFHVGQLLDLVVIVSSSNPKRLRGSYRQAIGNPWPDFAKNTAPGTEFDGAVTSVVDYGAFVRLDNGFEGLLHNSQLAGASQLLPGEELKVSVLAIDATARRLQLGMRRPS